jgi:hypothetical protein
VPAFGKIAEVPEDPVGVLRRRVGKIVGRGESLGAARARREARRVGEQSGDAARLRPGVGKLGERETGLVGPLPLGMVRQESLPVLRGALLPRRLEAQSLEEHPGLPAVGEVGELLEEALVAEHGVLLARRLELELLEAPPGVVGDVLVGVRRQRRAPGRRRVLPDGTLVGRGTGAEEAGENERGALHRERTSMVGTKTSAVSGRIPPTR